MMNPYMQYPYYSQNQYQNQVPSQIPNQMQIQNGGLMIARSIEDAEKYPVAPGTCVTFKIENEKMICEKIMGFSNLEQPVFKKYHLEEIVDEQQKKDDESYALKSDLESLQQHITELEKKYGTLDELDKKIEALRRTKVVKPQEVTANA